MSFWDTPNPDALTITPSLISAGPRLGFLGALEASLDEQTRYSNAFGGAIALQDEEAANRIRISALGETAPPPLDTGLFGTAAPTHRYSEFRDAYTAMDPRPLADIVGDRNTQLNALKAKYPNAGILTYDDMVTAVQAKSDAARRRAAADKDFLGGFGAFVGTSLGFFDPRTNPLGFAALGVSAPASIGGVAIGAAARIGLEGVLQAGVQAAQTPLAQANQRSLGGNPTTEDALLGIALAGIGGAAFRGIGEGVSRWFVHTPTDPAPPPPKPVERLPSEAVQTAAPLSAVDRVIANIEGANTRIGRTRIEGDINFAADQLGSWSVLPHEVVPPTEVRLPWDGKFTAPEIRSLVGAGETLDEVARRLDPETFRIYDALAVRRDQIRGILTVTDSPEARAILAARSTVDTALDSARAKLAAATTPKQIAKATAEVTALEEQAGKMKVGSIPETTGSPANYVADLRAELVKADQNMRDLAPTVTRAYARAQGKWNVYEDQRAQIQAMIDGNKHQLGPILEGAAKLAKEAPVATPTSAVAGPLKEAVETGTKATEEAVAQYSSVVEKALSDANVDKTLSIEGIDTKLHLDNDKLIVPTEDGTGEREISVRQLLEETREDADTLKAVGSCSIAKTS